MSQATALETLSCFLRSEIEDLTVYRDSLTSLTESTEHLPIDERIRLLCNNGR